MEWNFFDIGAKILAYFYSKMIIDLILILKIIKD